MHGTTIKTTQEHDELSHLVDPPSAMGDPIHSRSIGKVYGVQHYLEHMWQTTNHQSWSSEWWNIERSATHTFRGNLAVIHRSLLRREDSVDNYRAH